MNSNPVSRYRRYMPPIMAAVLAAAVAIPAARAGGEPDLVNALRAKGAQIVPLGARGGLKGYLVTPEGGDGYSLYVTGDGHGVAGLLYGPGGALLTGGQLAAVRGGNNPVGTAPRASIKPLLPPLHGVSPLTPERPALPPPGVCGSPVPGSPEETASGAGARGSATAAETATPDTAPKTVKGASREDLFGRAPVRFRLYVGRTRAAGRPVRRCALSVVAFRGGADWPRGDGRQAPSACRPGGAAGRGVCPPRGGKSPPVPTRRKPGSPARRVRPVRPVPKLWIASRGITPSSTPGASAPCR